MAIAENTAAQLEEGTNVSEETRRSAEALWLETAEFTRLCVQKALTGEPESFILSGGKKGFEISTRVSTFDTSR